jgi:hypothetical protein
MAAALFLLGALTTWWSQEGYDYELAIGPMAGDVCYNANRIDRVGCEPLDLSKSLEPKPGGLVTFGRLAFAGGFLSAALLVTVGIVGLVRKRPGVVLSLARLSIAFCLLTLLMAVGYLSSGDFEKYRLGTGLPLFFGAGVLAVAGSIVTVGLRALLTPRRDADASRG